MTEGRRAALAAWLSAEGAVAGPGADSAIRGTLLADAALSLGSGEPGRWFPFAALCEVLLWQGRPVAAADLAEATIAAYAPAGAGPWPLADEDTPFRDALLAERLLAPERADPARLTRVTRSLDRRSRLATSLEFARSGLRKGRVPIHELLSGYEDWNESPRPLRPPYTALWDRRDALTPAETESLWAGVHAARDPELARELATIRHGVETPLWYVPAWLAGIAVRRGDPERARQLLRDAAPTWAPFASWQVMPVPPVLQPDLLPAASDEFRAEMLAAVPTTLRWI